MQIKQHSQWLVISQTDEEYIYPAVKDHLKTVLSSGQT